MSTNRSGDGGDAKGISGDAGDGGLGGIGGIVNFNLGKVETCSGSV
ncbi:MULTISPECIES: hypothetical protein [Mesorhizobium]|nr:hypothetical protein [Mesorhizobium sp.]